MITRLRLTAILLLAGAAGCQDYLFEQKFPEKIKEAQIIVPAARPTPADILFVIDNSGSMADEQDRLATNFEAFIKEIAGAGDYQIAVVSTDFSVGMGDPGEFGGRASTAFASQSPFNLIDFNTTGCAPLSVPHACFLGPDPAKRIISSQRLNREEQIAAFQANVRLGSCGSGAEQGLKATIEGLSRTRAGECNAGFLRSNANLVVIIVSDEQDTDNTPVAQYVSDLGTFKDYSNIRVAMIVGSVDGRPTNCRIPNNGTCGQTVCSNRPTNGSHNACMPGGPQTQCPGPSAQIPQGEFCQRIGMTTNGQCENKELEHFTTENCGWCSFYNTPDCCSALNGSRYIDFAHGVETRVNQADPLINVSNCAGGGDGGVACLIDSICQENFSTTLSRIARELIITNKYTLDPPATYPEGVTVRVKGGRFGAGVQLVYGTEFTISNDGRTLTVTAGEKTPKEGEEIEIYFVVAS